MATAKRKKKAEPKKLELVCKCGDCSHWKIILVRSNGRGELQHEFIKCMSCGIEIGCYFSTGPHEGLHYENLAYKGKGKTKAAAACSTKS